MEQDFDRLACGKAGCDSRAVMRDFYLCLRNARRGGDCGRFLRSVDHDERALSFPRRRVGSCGAEKAPMAGEEKDGPREYQRSGSGELFSSEGCRCRSEHWPGPFLVFEENVIVRNHPVSKANGKTPVRGGFRRGSDAALAP